MKHRYWAAAILFAMAACSSGEKAATENSPAQTSAEAKPEKDDKYHTLMTKNLLNYQDMAVGFMNFDMGKVKTAAGNMVAISQYLAGNIPPAYQSKTADWQAWCGELGKSSSDILQKVQANDHEGLRASFESVMKTCMECHMLYRKHLLSGSGSV